MRYLTEMEKARLQALKDAYEATLKALPNTNLLASYPPQSAGAWEAGCNILHLMEPLWIPEPKEATSPEHKCLECGYMGWSHRPGEYRKCGWKWGCAAPKEDM